MELQLSGLRAVFVYFPARRVVLDVVFVSLSVVFFIVSIGYVAACDRLMK